MVKTYTDQHSNTTIEYDDICDYQMYEYQNIFAKELKKSLIKNGESIMNKETDKIMNDDSFTYPLLHSVMDISKFWTAMYSNPKIKKQDNFKDLKPNRIIYNGKTTICYFPDGDKVIVTCSNNEQQFEKEFGVMACIVKKLYGTRSEFLRIVEKGYTQPELKKKETQQEVNKEFSKFLRLTKDG